VDHARLGVSSTVWALALDAAGALYAAGGFTTAAAIPP